MSDLTTWPEASFGIAMLMFFAFCVWRITK